MTAGAEGAPAAGPVLENLFDPAAPFHRTFRHLYEISRGAVDDVLFELVRLRMAQLHGADFDLSVRYLPARRAGLAEETLAELPQWPTSPRYGERERACIGLAEQFVIQSSGVTDADIDRVSQHLSSREVIDLVAALNDIDAFQRSTTLLGVTATSPVPSWLPDFVSAEEG